MSIIYADDKLSGLSAFKNTHRNPKKAPFGLDQIGSIDLDYLVWAVSDKLRASVGKRRLDGAPARPADGEVPGLHPSGPYGIGFEATDRLWQAKEAGDAAQAAQTTIVQDESRVYRRRYAAAGLALLLTTSLIGYQFTGHEAAPTATEALAPLAVEPPSPDVLAALINVPAEAPVSEPLISNATPPLAHLDKPFAVTRPMAVTKSKVMPVSTVPMLAKNAKQMSKTPLPLPRLNAKLLPLLAPAPLLLAAMPAAPRPMISNPFKATAQPVTTIRQPSLVPIVRPPASIGTQTNAPVQTVPAASPAAASPQTYASNASQTSSGGGQTSSNGSQSMASSGSSPAAAEASPQAYARQPSAGASQPMIPPAAIPAAAAAAVASQKKNADSAPTKPTIIDAMFPRLYLLSQAMSQ